MTKTCLVATALTEFWDTDAHQLFLGPWCLAEAKNRQLAERSSHALVPSPWSPVLKVKEAADHCQGLYEELLAELARGLNLLHGIDRPERYWRVLIGPWLAHFIAVVYERYARIEHAGKLFTIDHTFVLPEHCCGLASLDTYHFVSVKGQAAQDVYNLKLFSRILRHYYPEKIIEREWAQAGCDAVQAPPDKFLKRSFYQLKKMRDFWYKPNIILSDMYRFDVGQMLLLETAPGDNDVGFEAFQAPVPGLRGSEYSLEQRRALTLEERPDRFQAFLRALIPEAIPMCYVEGFDRYRRAVRDPGALKAVGSAVGWYFNEGFKFFAAEAMAKGAKLMDFQHGGGYGTALSFPSEDLSTEKDVFYTWGWDSVRTDNTRVLAGPYLSRLKDTHRPTQDRILFISNATHKYVCRFFSITLADDMPQYFKDKARFLSALDGYARARLRYRPYPEIGWHEQEQVQAMAPWLKMSGRGKLSKLMPRVKLIVVDHHSTSHLEAFTINAPCLCFWDHDTNPVRPEAEDAFEALRKAGILLRTPEEAARKVNEIARDPAAWWRSPDVQQAKDKFCARFAVTNHAWRQAWMDEFNGY